MLCLLLLLATCGLTFGVPRITVAEDNSISIADDLSWVQCDAHSPDFVFYNRIPKTSSTTIQFVYGLLHSRLEYETVVGVVTHSNMTYMDNMSSVYGLLGSPILHDLIEQLKRDGVPVLLDMHLHYIPYDEFEFRGFPHPVWINTIRDPVERLMSLYDYERWGDRDPGFTDDKLSTPLANMTFDECVRRHQSGEPALAEDCLGFDPMVRYFCGLNPICGASSLPTLERAIRHILRSYLTVGLSSRVEETLEIFEAILPRFFEGARQLYYEFPSDIRHSRANTNKRSPAISEDMRKYVLSYNRLDMALYDWLARAFERQLQLCRHRISSLGETEHFF
eukprot:Rmarinus@m.14198